MKELNTSLESLNQVIGRLRKECPWDSVQTHDSLKECLLNETQEVIEGINILEQTGNGENLCEELGDLLMQILLHSTIAEEEGKFTLYDVIEGIEKKMKFRHPKIFDPDNKELTALSWKELKKLEHDLNILNKKQDK